MPSKKIKNRESLIEQYAPKKAIYNYQQKRTITAKLLRLLDFKGIEAYFVKKISEKSCLKLCFWTMTNMLMKENVFINEVRNSLVDSYINQKY